MNTKTLRNYYASRICWVDIEVPNIPINMTFLEILACYPRSTFYPLCDNYTTILYRIIRAYSFEYLFEMSFLQSSTLHILFFSTVASLRYSFEDYRPNKTNHELLLLCFQYHLTVFHLAISLLSNLHNHTFHIYNSLQ